MLPIVVSQRYQELKNETGELEDSPQGADPEVATFGERECDTDHVIWTKFLDQRLNELPLYQLAQATLTPS